eukprot:6845333-Pyramimonas_sp.AAC.1
MIKPVVAETCDASCHRRILAAGTLSIVFATHVPMNATLQVPLLFTLASIVVLALWTTSGPPRASRGR